MYAAPVWLHGNIATFKGFLAKTLLKISGSQFYSHGTVLEVLFGMPPLKLMLEIMTIKFALKGLSLDDEMTATLLQIEEMPTHIFYSHIAMTKEYLAWNRSDGTHARNIELLAVPDEEIRYTQIVMQKYMCSKWDRLVTANDLESFVEKDDTEALALAASMVNTFQVVGAPVFMRSERRVENSDTIDFLHGHCLRFQSFKRTVTKTAIDDTCLDCSSYKDSPVHKLFYCPTFAGQERDDLLKFFEDNQTGLYKVRLLFAPIKGLRRAFKNQVHTICRDSLHDDCYEQST